MVYESRVATSRRKPKLILTTQFPITADMEIGEEGQLDVVLLSKMESLEFDDTETEVKHTEFSIISAKRLTRKETRI